MGKNDLAVYCQREGIKHVLFDNFSKVLPVMDSIVKGSRTIHQVIEVAQ